MTGRLPGLVCVALLCVVRAGAVRAQQSQTPPAAAPAAPGDSTRLAAVTYISGTSVYLAAGRADGVREGMVLDIVRSGSVIATVRATYLSSRSSSCEVVSSTAQPAVGDSARFVPVVDPVAASGAATALSAPRTVTSVYRRPIRGHVGIRYLSVAQPNIGGAETTQPSADVRVEGNRVGGTGFGFVLDGRSRRNIGATPSTTEGQTRVYQASMSLTSDRTGARVSVGRQYSIALSAVSLFDGVTMELNRPRWGVGAFGGLQPDALTMQFSTDIREYGAYVQLHNRPAASAPWSLTSGAVSSTELGQVNREFGFVQMLASGRIASFYATQEVDYNRGWKRAAGEPAFSPTSSFASVQVRPTDWFSVQGGFDNRRNVRLYRDFVSPETEFDDAFREGVWGGATVTLFHKLRVGGDGRVSRGGLAGDATYYTGSLGVDPVTRARIDVRLRSTRFTTVNTLGWLHAWSVGVEPFRATRFEVNGGLRTYEATGDTTSTGALSTTLPNANWIGATIDLSLGRNWYFLLSGSNDGSGPALTRQLYGSLLFRF